MTGKALLNGKFAAFSLVIRTLGGMGILAISIFVAYFLINSNRHFPWERDVHVRVDPEMRLSPEMVSEFRDYEQQQLELQTQVIKNQETIISNQKLIIELLNDGAKVALRQSIILDNIVRLQEQLMWRPK